MTACGLSREMRAAATPAASSSSSRSKEGWFSPTTVQDPLQEQDNGLNGAQNNGEETQEESVEAENAEGFSWEQPEEGIAFSTRIAGRRIPDYLRELMQNARSLKPDAQDGVPPPATLAQLRRRAEEDADAMKEVLRSEAYYSGSVSSSVRQAEGGTFEVVYLAVLGPRTMIRNFVMKYSGHPDGGPGLVESATELGLQPERAATAARVIDFTQKTITHLHNNGYPDAKLDRRRVIVDLSASLADVTLHITAGERYVFGPALISNEDGRTETDYVRELMTFRQGEVYSRAEVDATQDALREMPAAQCTSTLPPPLMAFWMASCPSRPKRFPSRRRLISLLTRQCLLA